MNDAHGLEEVARRECGQGDYDGWALLCPSTHWREHPEFHRAPWRWERSWEGAYDYGFAEVRAHHLALVGELCERFDMDGLELDWLRWGMMFAPGHEAAGRRHLTAFVREARRLVDGCAKRIGRRVQLGVRVPGEPRQALALGYDVPAWVREGLVDQVVLSTFSGLANFDYPIELWRLMLGDRVRLLTHGSGVASPYPAYGRPVGHDELHNGCAASALHRGSQGIYLFNECYTESSDPDRLKRMLRRLGSLDTLSAVPRRHAVTFPGNHAPGDAPCTLLPIPLTPVAVGWDFGRMENCISLRIHTGPRPIGGAAFLLLAFSPETPPLDPAAMPVRLNGTPLATAGERPPSAIEANSIDWTRDYRDRIGSFLGYCIPLDAVQDDTNVVEFVPPEVPGELRWAEILIQPA